MIQMSDPRSRRWGKMRHETLPPEHLFGRRLEMLTLAVISQLRATANWHRIAREWVYGDEPVTELGRQEAEFYARALSATARWRGSRSLAALVAAALRRRAQRLAVGRAGAATRSTASASPGRSCSSSSRRC